MKAPAAAEPREAGVVSCQSAVGERPLARAGQGAEALWLGAALVLTLLFAARAMAPALAADTIQDDARGHVFWMARFRDPTLFRGDLIADYYQALAPPGYSALYWILSRAMDPALASKLLPPALGAVTAVFTYLFVRRLHPAPPAAFLASVLFCWYLWQYDDLVSATSRAFLPPSLAALLWSLVAGRLALTVTLIAEATLLYPVGGALGATLAAVRLVEFRRGRPRLTRRRAAWIFCLAATGLVGVLSLLSYAAGAPFGPAVNAEQARSMEEFGRDGRNAFFSDDPYRYWIVGERSGLDLRVGDAFFRRKIPIFFELLALASPLPLLMLLRRRVASVARLSGGSVVLLQLLAASFGLFFLAHLLLFRLYLPSRYVKWSVPLVLACAAGIVLVILAETVASRVAGRVRGLVVAALAVALGTGLAMYPAHYEGDFIHDPHPAISAYLRSLPPNTLIAGPSVEADSVPLFAHQPVLVSREHALAYHLGYYAEVRRRIDDLIAAYYAETPLEIAAFASRYGVSMLLVDRAAFHRETYADVWGGAPGEQWEPFTSKAGLEAQRARHFALLDLARRCAVADDGAVAVVPASCAVAER